MTGNGDGRIHFEWDPAKAIGNAREHRVTFDEAETVFADFHSMDTFDPDHSHHDDRFVKLGMSSIGRLLVVVYTQRGMRIRIISARRANRQEKMLYENQI